MKTKNLLFGCLALLQLMACSPKDEENEKHLLEEEMRVMQLSLLRQQVEMDSMSAAEEIEMAQQIIIEQQLTDLKAKMLGAETGLSNGLVSGSPKKASRRSK